MARINFLKDEKGMSIVSVLTAFSLLMLGVLTTVSAMTLAQRTTNEGIAVRSAAQEAVEAFYADNGYGTVKNRLENFDFVPVDGGEAFSIEGAKGYEYTYKTPGGRAFSFFYFHSRGSGGIS